MVLDVGVIGARFDLFFYYRQSIFLKMGWISPILVVLFCDIISVPAIFSNNRKRCLWLGWLERFEWFRVV